MIKYFLAFCLVFGFSYAVMAQDAPSVRYVNATQAQQLLSTDISIKVIDVRTHEEYKRGHIDGALRINYFSLSFRKSLRALDREAPYLVHCKSGHRSTRALKIMQDEGFTDIIHLDGGYDAYKALAETPAAP